jgi:hypothetical protein
MTPPSQRSKEDLEQASALLRCDHVFRRGNSKAHSVSFWRGGGGRGRGGPGLTGQGPDDRGRGGPELSGRGRGGPGLSGRGRSGPGLTGQGPDDRGRGDRGQGGPGLTGQGRGGPGLSGREGQLFLVPNRQARNGVSRKKWLEYQDQSTSEYWHDSHRYMILGSLVSSFQISPSLSVSTVFGVNVFPFSFLDQPNLENLV